MTCKPIPGGMLCVNGSYSQMCEEREKVLRGTKQTRRERTQALLDENNRLLVENEALRRALALLKGEKP